MLSSKSMSIYDLYKNRTKAVANEAIEMCSMPDGRFTTCGTMLHVYSLSTVLRRKIHSCYPDANPCLRPYYNTEIKPRTNTSAKTIYILWSRDGNLDSRVNEPYQPNHFVPLLPLFEKHLRANNEEPHLQVQDILPLDFVTLGVAITHKTQEDDNWTCSCLQSLPTFAATTHTSFSCPSIQAIQPFEIESVQPEISEHFLESECLATCHTDTTKVVATIKCVMDSSIEFITDKCKDQTLSCQNKL